MTLDFGNFSHPAQNIKTITLGLRHMQVWGLMRN